MFVRSFATLVAFLSISNAGNAAPPFTALPGPIETRNPPVVWNVTAPDAITLMAGPGANWFVSPGTTFRVDSAPTLLIHPTGNFSLSAKLSLQPQKRWDSGCLALVLDNDHWAKLCLENPDGDGKLAVVSVVNQVISDDVYTDFFSADGTIYLKVVQKGAAFQFLASRDGKNWRMFRVFAFENSGAGQLRTGLLAQSPVGDGMTVTFSEIRYETKS